MANHHQQYQEVGTFQNVFGSMMGMLAALIVTPFVLWGVGYVVFWLLDWL